MTKNGSKAILYDVSNQRPFCMLKVRGTEMLSLTQLRKIDPALAHLSDDEIIEVRDSLYDLGGLVFDDWLENGEGSKYPVRFLQRLKESNKMDICQPQEPKQE
jgi:hypothetical protein